MCQAPHPTNPRSPAGTGCQFVYQLVMSMIKLPPVWENTLTWSLARRVVMWLAIVWLACSALMFDVVGRDAPG